MKPMNERTMPDDLIMVLSELRALSASVSSRVSSATEHQENVPAWAGKLMGALGAVEGVLSVALDGPPVEDRRHVLVVDDQGSTRQMLSMLLGGAGFTIMEAESVATGIALLNVARFDLLVTDIHLPDGSGLRIAEHAKGCVTSAGTQLPVIAISADAEPSTIDSVKALGAHWVWKKTLLTDLPVLAKSAVIAPSTQAVAVPAGVVDHVKVESITALAGPGMARKVVERALHDVNAQIVQLPATRAEGNIHAWRERCHAIHGSVMWLGATRMDELLADVLRKSDVEIERSMSDHERQLGTELRLVEAYYAKALSAA